MVRAMILRGTDKVKEWTESLEGAMLDDGLDDVAIDETSPVGRQAERATVNKFLEAIGAERLLRIIETAFDWIKYRRLVSLP